MASARHADIPKQAQPGDILLVVHEFVARSPDELSLAKGDRIELIERDDDFGDGWYLGRHLQNGNTGLFPEVYTTTAPRSLPSSVNKQKVQSLRSSSSPVSTKSPGGIETSEKTPLLADSPTTNNYTSANNGVATTAGIGMPSPAQLASLDARTRSFPSSSPVLAGGSPTTAYPNKTPTQPSAVMNETLSVIDEHITNMNKPSRHEASPMSSIAEQRPSSGDSASQYSGHASQTGLPLPQHSDPEDDSELSEQEVVQWSPDRVAEYLESIGVEKAHCELFRTEEFTGEVLLQMDQSQLFMKELDLGPIGRRMKTWQKIKALQDEVMANKATLDPRSSQSTLGRNQKPYQPPFGAAAQASGQSSPRPSAASINSLGHRRHSSTDQTPTSRGSRTKQSSFDRGWTMSGASSTAGNNPTRSMSANHLHTVSADRGPYSKASRSSSQMSLSGQTEGDKGYTSGGESDPKRSRNVLKKRDGTSVHERTPSYSSEKRRSAGFFWQRQRGDSAATPVDASDQASATRYGDGVRIVSEPLQANQTSPTVTRLEYDEMAKNSPDESKRVSTASDKGLGFKSRGFRTISDAITGREKSLITTTDRNITDSSMTQSPDSTSAAGLTPTYDADEASKSELSTPALGLHSSATKRKPKKATSAYIRGLEKKSPLEQMKGCDYSGWMKKKSSNLMSTWKPRLFVLRGRRLSYYYSETDTEEKGVIDISNHRVLPADSDLITNMHATLTGATAASPSSPLTDPNTPMSPRSEGGGNRLSFPAVPSLNPSSPAPAPVVPRVESQDNQAFLFKLVPPRSGLSKGVNFTRPSVHYFAVPSREEGRLWMGALMKATIDRDETMSVVTTYQQKTISLEQARARKERPPFLMGVGEEEEDSGRADSESQTLTSVATTAGSQEKSIEQFDAASTTTTEYTDSNLAEKFGSENVAQTEADPYQTNNERPLEIRPADGSGLGIQGLNSTGSVQNQTSAI